ncbi:Polysialic acid transport protein KpsM [Nymphon striatum]|nr:Polysialic acid transport protein KpsM [Nymphon striatum]
MSSPLPSTPLVSDEQTASEIAPALQPIRNRKRRFASARTIVALILREMSTRYGRTPGGYLWNVLEPLAAILFLSLGFSLLIRTPALGNSFLLFYATGYTVFNLYGSIQTATQAAIRYSKPLLRYPAVTWLDAILARFLLNALTGILTLSLLITGILLVIDSRTVVDLPPVLEALFLALVLGLGMGTLNCVLTGMFPLWRIIWSILNRPLMIASGVLYLFDDLPRVAQDILWFNPLIHIIGLMRSGSMCLLLAMTLLALGLLLMGRFHRDILTR